MDLRNRDGALGINLAGCKGKTFSWICKNRPDLVLWARGKVPDCCTDLFLLVQYADSLHAEEPAPLARKWSRLREAHREYVRNRRIGDIAQRDVNGCILKKRKIEEVRYSFIGD